MFRAKTTTRRNTKRAISPLQAATNTQAAEPTSAVAPVASLPENSSFEKNLTNFFEAESSASSNTKPWLRLERGIRLQKLRAFAEEQPGYTAEEKDILNKMLVKANDAKVLNTKQQIQYENGKIVAIRGLRKVTDGEEILFKIDVQRATKKRTDDGNKNE